MKYHMPSYYEFFVCIAGGCPDNCCNSWEVVIDETTRARYETLEGPLGDRVRSYLRLDNDGDSYLAFADGRCPMLLESGLCSLQKAYGEGMLSAVCNRYPRYIYEFGGLTEVGVSLSCPAACDLILHTPFSICETVNSDPPSINDIDPMAFYTALKGRDIAFQIAEDRRFPVFSRMALILALGRDLEDAMDDPSEVLADWKNPDVWPEKLDAIQPKRRGDFAKLRSVFQQMAVLCQVGKEQFALFVLQLAGSIHGDFSVDLGIEAGFPVRRVRRSRDGMDLRQNPAGVQTQPVLRNLWQSADGFFRVVSVDPGQNGIHTLMAGAEFQGMAHGDAQTGDGIHGFKFPALAFKTLHGSDPEQILLSVGGDGAVFLIS